MRTKIFTIIAAILLIQLIFLASFRTLVFNQAYYKSQLVEVGTYSRIPDADLIIADMIDYLQGDKESLQEGIFNERETSHMADVKTLINQVIIYLYILAAIFITLNVIAFNSAKGKFKTFIINYIFISGLTIIAAGLLLYTLSNWFPSIFESFHLTFFKPGSYMFPETDTLIRLFPEKFFYNFLYTIVSNAMVISAVLLGISILVKYIKYKNINTRKNI